MRKTSSVTWERSRPSGAWQVTDARLYELGAAYRSRLYFGYTKREAKAEHAQFVRELVAARQKKNARP